MTSRSGIRIGLRREHQIPTLYSAPKDRSKGPEYEYAVSLGISKPVNPVRGASEPSTEALMMISTEVRRRGGMDTVLCLCPFLQMLRLVGCFEFAHLVLEATDPRMRSHLTPALGQKKQ